MERKEYLVHDVKNIMELKTASKEAKARMIVDLIKSHDEVTPTQIKTSEFIPPRPIVNTTSGAKRKYRRLHGNKSWRPEEDLVLFNFYFQEKDKARTMRALYKKLSKELGRTPTAIEIRLGKKGWKNLNTAPEIPNELKNIQPKTSEDWKNITESLNNLKPKKKTYKKGGKKIPVTQTEIDTVHREKGMGTPIQQIAKLLNVKYKRVETIDYKIRKGVYKPTKLKDNTVEVGQDTKLPKKFRYLK